MASLLESKELIEKVFELGGFGQWKLNLVTKKLEWDLTVKSIHEVAPDYESSIEAAISFYKEGHSRYQIRSLLEALTPTDNSYSITLPLVSAKGNTKWIESFGIVEFEGDTCICIHGICRDVTHTVTVAHKNNQKQKELEFYISTSNMGTFEINIPTDTVSFNDRFAEILGYRLEEINNISKGMQSAVDSGAQN